MKRHDYYLLLTARRPHLHLILALLFLWSRITPAVYTLTPSVSADDVAEYATLPVSVPTEQGNMLQVDVRQFEPRFGRQEQSHVSDLPMAYQTPNRAHYLSPPTSVAIRPSITAIESPDPTVQTLVTQGAQTSSMNDQYGTATPFHIAPGGLTSTLKGPCFWDTPLHSGAIVHVDDQQVIMPGPDDRVRLIVQLRNDPIAVYIKRTFGAPRRLTASETYAVNNYADSLSASQNQVLAQIEQQGMQVHVNGRFSYLLNGLALSTEMRNLHSLKQLPQAKAVYPDYEVRVVLDDSVPLIGAPQVWQMADANGDAVTGQGIRAAIIDTGVDYTHPDLGGCFGPSCRIIGGYDFVNNDYDPIDDHGHGTHVAGIVAANGTVTGVAPDASLLAYKVLDAYGTGWSSDVIAALERAADPDSNPATDDAAHVINLSLGSLGGDPDDPQSQAVDNAVDLGIVVVAGAGNDGPSYQTIVSPGTARQALTVTASDKSDQLASFSSRGPIPGFFNVLKPDIAAPGDSIYSTVPASGQLGSPSRYRSLSGTSMATPHIAGAAALIRQLHPDWTPETIKANLMNTANDLGIGLYEQGAGRVRLMEAATAPLVAVPGSLGFGVPLEDTTSTQLTLVNVSTTTVTTTASISTALWYDGGLMPLAAPVPVPYAQLSDDDFIIAPGTTNVLTVSLSIPPDALEGYYTGKIVLQAANDTLTVPYAFTLVSKVTIHILDENGVELPANDESFIYFARVPEIDIQQWFYYQQVPLTVYIPSGTYNIHSYSRWRNYYDHVFQAGAVQQSPLLLATSTTIVPHATQHVYLNAATAHRFTLDVTTFAGDPLFMAQWRMGSRYQNAENEYSIYMFSGLREGDNNTDLLAPLPTGLDFYISDTPDHTSFTFASEGYGYSTHYLHFTDLNSTEWYEGPEETAGFNLVRNADEVYLFEWYYPAIDASTSTTFTYLPAEVSRYKVKYDSPGTVDDSYWGFASSADAVFQTGVGFIASIRPISAGWERNVYVNGVSAYDYWAGHNWQPFEREFYLRDWTKSYTFTWEGIDFQAIDGWDLQPLSPKDETISLGAGPLYPAVTFDNVTSTIRLVHPVFGASRGNKVAWSNDPTLTLYRNDQLVYSDELFEHYSMPSVLRLIPATAGNYRGLVTSSYDAQISYDNTVEVGFTLPAADMNPPQVTALEMPQRFAPGQVITASLEANDPDSGVSNVEMRYSTDEGTSWTPLSLAQNGMRYTAVIDPGLAQTLSLAFTITDGAGNYMTFTTLGAAIRETPVTLNLEISPTTMPLSSDPFTIHLSGTLRTADDQPLSEAALPIAIYLNDQLAGYVRDVARLADGTFQHGTIDFDWTLIPTDFISSPEPAQLKFVFDMGTYARQEKVFATGVIGVTPTSYNETLARSSTVTRTLLISNSGSTAVDFAVVEMDGGFALAQGRKPAQRRLRSQAYIVNESEETTPDTLGWHPLPLNSGSPDSFGYTYRDSSEVDGPTYQWIEIARPAGGSGTEITDLTGAGYAYFWPLPLPFSFDFYGTDHTELAVASNGTLYFEDEYLGLSNTEIPGPNGYGIDTFIAHLWDDLDIAPGAVYYQALDSMFIIEYYRVSWPDSPDHATWEVIIFDNGNILFQYQDVTFGNSKDYGGSATVGIQGDTATGLQYSYNTPALSDGLAICFAYPGQSPDCSLDVPWLSEDPITGTLAADSTQAVDVIFDASVPEVAQPGKYYATLFIQSNDPGIALRVPVTMTVKYNLFLPLIMKEPVGQ